MGGREETERELPKLFCFQAEQEHPLQLISQRTGGLAAGGDVMPPEKDSDLLSRGTCRLPGVSTARGPGVQGRVTITLVHHTSDLQRHLYQLQGLRVAQDRSDFSGFGVIPKISVGASQDGLSYTQSTRKSQGCLGCHETSQECKIMFNLFIGLWVLFFPLTWAFLPYCRSVFSFSESESKEPCLMKNT